MNKIVNKFLLAGDKFILEMHFKNFFKNLNLLIVLQSLWTILLKTRKEFKNSKKQEIQDIYIYIYIYIYIIHKYKKI